VLESNPRDMGKPFVGQVMNQAFESLLHVRRFGAALAASWVQNRLAVFAERHALEHHNAAFASSVENRIEHT